MSDTIDTPGTRPQGKAGPAVPTELHGLADTVHPLARRDFYTLMDRSEADLRWVLEAIDSRLGNAATTAKQEQANFTIQRFVDAHGHFPGPRELERWRAADPVRKRVLLSDGAIRKAFGGNWATVKAAWEVGSVDVDLTARRLTAVGPKFGEDELLAVGQAFVASMPPTGQLRRDDLQQFLDAQRGHNTTGLPRVPKKFDPFRRVFGGFENFLVALGQEHRSRFAISQLAALPSNSGEARFKGLRFRGTEEERLAGVSMAAERYGKLLSYPQYNAFRAEAIIAGQHRGEHVPWPHARTLIGKYGSWPGVKLAAGVFSEADVAAGAQRNVLSDDELVDALAQALVDCGLDMTASRDYRLWKVRRQMVLAAEGKPLRVPSARLLSERLGGPEHRFTVAIQTTLERRSDVAARLRARAA